MEKTDYQYAQAKLAQFKMDYQVDVLVDWGHGNPDPNEWKPGTWTRKELDRLHEAICLMVNIMGGNEQSPLYIVYPNPTMPDGIRDSANVLASALIPGCEVLSLDEFRVRCLQVSI